jgi:hypothetical protein
MEAVMYGFAGGTRLTGPVVEGWLPALSQPFRLRRRLTCFHLLRNDVSSVATLVGETPL